MIPNHIRAIKPYKVSQSSSINYFNKNILKLDWNESTIPPSDHVIDALFTFLKIKIINYYPGVKPIYAIIL